MFEDVGRGVHRDRKQPFPPSKRLSFVGESRAIAQRARESLIRPALTRGLAPELEVDRRDGKLVHRRHMDHLQLASRELVFRIEFAQRIDCVAEKLESYWRLSSRWPNVEDPAAHRELTYRANRIFAHVTRSHQPIDERFQRVIFVASNHGSGSSNGGWTDGFSRQRS